MAVKLTPVQEVPSGRSSGAVQKELEEIRDAFKAQPGQWFQIGEDQERSPDRFNPLRQMEVELRVTANGKLPKLNREDGSEEMVTVYKVYGRYIKGYKYTPKVRNTSK